MPRDDLTIDFVAGAMPPLDSTLDPALILDDWANRVVNLPEEIKFVQDEIADKDRQAADCLKKIDDHDGRLQRWIKANGSHASNPKEQADREAVVLNFAKAEQLADEKVALTQRLQKIMDKHLRHLDAQIKILYDRGEPGFVDPDELPSLLRPSAANISAPSARTANPSANPVTAALGALANPAVSLGPKGTNTQLRNIQTTSHHAATASSSAPVSPAASMIMKRGARETSAGPGSGVPARPRLNTNLGSLPNTSSGLARHSSLGPGTPKGLTASGHQRSGSAGPRAGVKGGTLPVRKGTPSGGGGGGRSIKKSSTGLTGGNGGGGGGGPKSGLQRVRKTAKNSPSSTADSELSDADSAVSSNDSMDAPLSQRGGRGTPARNNTSTSFSNHHNNNNNSSSNNNNNNGNGNGNGNGHYHHPPHTAGAGPRTKRDDHHHNHPAHPNDLSYVDDDEGNDDRKYCMCQKVSFGDMIACDNEHCPYEWFHWSCVGLKSEPTGGKWYCPVCVKEREKKK
ncbi:unnamed protein product [Discula destructiva]